MKHRLRNSIIILLVTGIMLYLLLKDNFNSIMEVIVTVNPIWILFAVVIYLIYFLTDTIPFYIYSRNYNDKIRFPFMLYLNSITKFFNGITPLATGGQPMQVYELRKKGTSTANSTNAAHEKHLPVYEKHGDEIIVKVGSTAHPMDKDHYIMWIAQVSKNRTTRVRLSPSEESEAHFPELKPTRSDIVF